MQNRNFINSQKDFNKDIYEFERKKQIIENKAKERAKIKSALEDKSNKIQINFKNEFVNDKTQKKYDELIQVNNKRNKEKEESIHKRTENYTNSLAKTITETGK